MLVINSNQEIVQLINSAAWNETRAEMTCWEGCNLRNFFICKITDRSRMWWYDVKVTYFQSVNINWSSSFLSVERSRLYSRSGNLENKTNFFVIFLYCSLQHSFLLRVSRYLLYQCTCRVKTISDNGFYQSRLKKQYWKLHIHIEF